jgi:hypothetical protein
MLVSDHYKRASNGRNDSHQKLHQPVPFWLVCYSDTIKGPNAANVFPGAYRLSSASIWKGSHQHVRRDFPLAEREWSELKRGLMLTLEMARSCRIYWHNPGNLPLGLIAACKQEQKRVSTTSACCGKILMAGRDKQKSSRGKTVVLTISPPGSEWYRAWIIL